MDALLDRMRALDATDLHLRTGQCARYRIGGDLERLEGPELGRDALDRLTREILTAEQSWLYESTGELGFGYGDAVRGRFRCSYFRERSGPAAAIRRLPATIPTLQELNLPENLEDFARARAGLVLVTGATGSGKTTTLASILDLINSRERRHIITLEEPIEYLYEPKRSLVHQRGVAFDIPDFAGGIADALREGPDVLLVGELRDVASIRLALQAAETGILVFSTLHTNGAVPACDRVLGVFPPGEQAQARAMLAQSLVGIVSQVLLRRRDAPGRIPATEILMGTPAVSTLVRENKIHEITSLLQIGRAQGMHTLDDSLESLVRRGIVRAADALPFAQNRSRFERLP